MSLLAEYGHNPLSLDDVVGLALGEGRAARRALRELGGGRQVVRGVTEGVRNLKRTRYGMALMRDPCAYCDAPVEDLDHIIARVRGGDDDETNLIGACGPCNSAKCAKPLLLFLRDRLAVE